MNNGPGFKALLIVTLANRSRRSNPFDKVYENESYANLSMHCSKRGIDLYVTHFENLLSETCAFAWNLGGSSWQLVDCLIPRLTIAYADLPQNFPTAVAFKDALRKHPITIINDLALSDCLTDKMATCELFSDHVPPTLSWNGSDVVARLQEADRHPDLSIRKLVLKPRFGERGRGIVITDLDGLAAYEAGKPKDYVIQAFLETKSGIPELNVRDRHDLRMIIWNGDVVLAFARIPAEGSYVSNYSQGGREVQFSPEDLSKRLVDFVSMVDSRLRSYGPRLYSLDVGIGQSGKIWIYELNTMPGIVWDDRPESRTMNSKMHRVIAEWMQASLPRRVL